MGRRRYEWTEARIQNHFKQGRGRGTHADYRPWLTVRDVPSRGRVHRIRGMTTGRVHHFLSDLENNLFLCLDWQSEVTDIREQFPLDRDATLRIALELGIRHPATRDGTPNVLTSDFLVVLGEGDARRLAARAVKPASELARPRVREKLELERRYWAARDVDWAIVTECELDRVLISNIEALRPYFDLTGHVEPWAGCFAALASRLLECCEALPVFTLGEACRRLGTATGVPPSTVFNVARHLVCRRVLDTDMRAPTPFEARMLTEFSHSPAAISLPGGSSC
jgi:hypothetical protein